MIENFKGKNNTNGLDANPQNINMDGRPKSSLRKINDTLLEQGHQPISKSEIEETYRLLSGLTEESLLALVADEKNPIIIRTVANYLVKDWMGGISAIDKVLDRAIGSTDAPTNVQNFAVITPDQAEFFARMSQLAK